MPALRLWHIYALKDPRTDFVRYIGRTCDPAKRLGAHLSEAQVNKATLLTHKDNWLRSLIANGLKPVMDILESGSGDWAEAERRWIARFRAEGNLINRTDGGDGVPGLEAKPESRLKMSLAAKARAMSEEGKAHLSLAGRNSHEKAPRSSPPIAWTFSGRKHTPETRAKISAIQIGKKIPAEVRARMSEAHRRRYESPDVRAITSAANRRRYQSPEARAISSAAQKAVWQKRKAQ